MADSDSPTIDGPANTDPTTVAGLVPDPKNRRKRTPRNVAMIADALRDVGASRSIVIDERGEVLAGNGVVEAAALAGISKLQIVDADGDTVIAVRRRGLSDEQKRNLAMYDNRAAELAEWNVDQLGADAAAGLDLQPFFFPDELDELIGATIKKGRTDPDAMPAPRPTAIVVGDLFALGPHRILCGDSARPADVARLMGGGRAVLLHADPPYGMGKESEGVLNDNQTGAALDDFLAAWWRACRPHVADNGSAYVWGNAETLWRWWFGWLVDSEPEINVRNEIVWDKGVASAGGVGLEGQEGLRQFPTASERALFLMFHKQSIGNLNADDFPESFEPLRAYLDGERARLGWTSHDIKRITGVGMYSHWFSRSQWALPSAANYTKLQAAAAGDAFTRTYADLRGEYEGTSRDGVDAVRSEFYAGRGYFDATESPCSDLWRFPRVTGAERFGHATPKPVAMIARAIGSSARPGDVVLEPFGGTGSTLIAAEGIDRACRVIELSPDYVQATIDRWEAFTGGRAVKVGEAARA